MLLIDGVRYHEWTPPTEDELEQMVKEHAQEIFGKNSIYLDIKHKLTSRAGVGSIPDGYVIALNSPQQWHIVEVELSSHQLYEHIVPQVSKFIAGVANPATRNQIVSALHSEIDGNDLWKSAMKKTIGSEEIYKFLSELISRIPCVTILIEKKTSELDDALNAINCPEKKVVEFRTYRREGAETVHAHLFEPLYEIDATDTNIESSSKEPATLSGRDLSKLDISPDKWQIGDRWDYFTLVDKKGDRLLWKSEKTGKYGVEKIIDGDTKSLLRTVYNEETARKVFETGRLD